MKQIDRNNTSLSEDANNLKTGQIEIKAYTDDCNNKIVFSLIAKKINIDWGDGNIEEMTPNKVGNTVIHEYLTQGLQTVIVNTKGITQLNCSAPCENSALFQELKFGSSPKLTSIHCSSQNLTLLDVNKCTALTFLDCKCNQLTSLDVRNREALTALWCGYNQLTFLDISNCVALKVLVCNNNQLSDSALNSLFDCLPKRNAYHIHCENNSGYDTCDKTIAEKWGWTIKEVDTNLYFWQMKDAGTISCNDCGFSEMTISSLYGDGTDNLGKPYLIKGYQCQSCGKFDSLEWLSGDYNIQCDCGGRLDMDMPLFCPQCKSKNMKYNEDNLMIDNS